MKSTRLFLLFSFLVSAVVEAAGVPAGAAESPRTIVYFDSKMPVSWIARGAAREMADYLKAVGFHELDAVQLAAWMKEKVETGAADTLVVMAQDVVPETLVDTAPGPGALIRKYLDAGGSVIWVADVPFYFVGKGEWEKEKWDYLGGRGVLGIDTVGNWQGKSTARPAKAGADWGLKFEWTSIRAVKPADVDGVLAADVDGAASAWTKNFKKFQTGFVRLWDNKISSFTDSMGEDLYKVLAHTVSGFDEYRKSASIYLFQPSDYYPLLHLEDGKLVREIQVNVFNNMPGKKEYELKVSGGGRDLGSFTLFEEDRTFFKANMTIPVFFRDQTLTLMGMDSGGAQVAFEVKLDEPAFHCDTEWSASPLRNPVDLGTFLFPADRVVMGTDQVVAVAARAFAPGSGAFGEVEFNLAITDSEGAPAGEVSKTASLTSGELLELDIESTVNLKPGKYSAALTVKRKDETLFEEKKKILVRETRKVKDGFGAYTTQISYDAPVPEYNRETKEWSWLDWDKMWRRGPHEDIVVAFPNGNRFVFWRGSSNVPFWASKYNVGLTYEWLEAAWGRGGLVDCLEPLQDKKCRYSRPYIVSNTPARAVIKWRYAIIDLDYTIADEEWAEETYYFYPDGFGTRTATGYFLPLTWHEANEFIVFTPAGWNPFDILPSGAVEILSPDGKKETIAYPGPDGKWSAGPQAVFRIRWNKRDASTPVMATRSFKDFIVQYDGWKVDGRYVSPSYWGVHYPVTRGYPTTVAAPPGWRERPAHASLTAIDSEPVDSKMYGKELETKTWAWLIGNSDLPDEELLKITSGWLDPPDMEVTAGGTGGKYDFRQRGYVVETGGGPVVLKVKGEDGDTVNPVFILNGFSKKSVSVSINGKTLYADEFRWAVESGWTGDEGVLWIAAEIPPGAEIRIE